MFVTFYQTCWIFCSDLLIKQSSRYIETEIDEELEATKRRIVVYFNWKPTRMLETKCDTVKPVCNDHLYNKMYYPWFIQ